MDGFDKWLRFFREVGFPTAVAVFCLWRVDGRLVDLERAAGAQLVVMTQLRDRAGVGCPAPLGPSGTVAPSCFAVPVQPAPQSVGPVAWRSLSLRGHRPTFE